MRTGRAVLSEPCSTFARFMVSPAIRRAIIWLAAMPRHYRYAGLMEYNDHCRVFSELLIILCRARQLALCDAYDWPSPWRKAGNEQADKVWLKQMTAAAARWNLITELALARKSPAARHITPDTYILCPRAPEPRAEPQRLAA
jgi:hypothetical protein